MKPNIVIGPWIGEFAYEFMCHVGHVRRILKENTFEKVVIASRTGHRYLYLDCGKFEYLTYGDDITQTDMFYAQDVKPMPASSKLAHYLMNSEFEWYHPKPLTPEQFDAQEFIPYGIQSRRIPQYDVIIHARNTDKCGSNYRNWARKNWLDLIQYLLLHEYKIACIGTKHAAMGFEGVDDYRGERLNKICDLLRNARSIVGPSSGPMHLASLCLCPQVVWTDNKIQGAINNTNRFRYETLWNPFDIETRVLDEDNWHPPVEKVIKAVEELL